MKPEHEAILQRHHAELVAKMDNIDQIVDLFFQEGIIIRDRMNEIRVSIRIFWRIFEGSFAPKRMPPLATGP
jgi:hypothetical protein